MNERRIITCRELIDFIADYVEGTLTADSLADFNRHLELCESCRAYLASYGETIRAARGAAVDDDDCFVPEEMIKAILDSRK